jgi:phage-related protein
MPDPIYREQERDNSTDKPLVWLHGEVKTPPFSLLARIEAGSLLRRIQWGEALSMPHSRPMPSIGPRCHELRIRDEGANFRIVYRVDPDAVLVAEVFSKKTQRTPQQVIDGVKRRLALYDAAAREASKKKRGEAGGPRQA